MKEFFKLNKLKTIIFVVLLIIYIVSILSYGVKYKDSSDLEQKYVQYILEEPGACLDSIPMKCFTINKINLLSVYHLLTLLGFYIVACGVGEGINVWRNRY
tara:strand:- start:885 stop:1187 length:303 start_codon:yes stop_codon:yes gene_type:complete